MEHAKGRRDDSGNQNTEKKPTKLKAEGNEGGQETTNHNNTKKQGNLIAINQKGKIPIKRNNTTIHKASIQTQENNNNNNNSLKKNNPERQKKKQGGGIEKEKNSDAKSARELRLEKEEKERQRELKRNAFAEAELQRKISSLKGGHKARLAAKLTLKHEERMKRKALKKQVIKEKHATEILLPEGFTGITTQEDEPETYELTQQDIADAVDIRAAHKAFDLTLEDYGPYCIDYTPSGKYLLIGGAKGHVATMNWDTKQLLGEFHLQKAIRDVKFLQTHNAIAVALKRHAYIYDQHGTEIHVLKKHNDVTHLEYLPYHFLLCTLGSHGTLMYQDMSTGQEVAEIRTHVQFARVMKQNPQNAILHVGHTNGVVSMWSPNLQEPVAKILAHSAPVSSLAISPAGTTMITAGHDARMHIWDIRTWNKLFSVKRYNVPSTMDISQKNILALGNGNTVQFWKNPFSDMTLYMQHFIPNGKVHDVKFCPFEDVLGLGHGAGFSSLLVPGSGEPNFDTLEANPLMSRKSRANHLVHSLLNKIPADTIALDNESFGTIHTEELTDEEKIRRNHPGFVNMRRAEVKETQYHVRLMEREKRKTLARKVEDEQKEQQEVKKQKLDELKTGPVANTLDRFKKNLQKRRMK